jgi:hypothetical protein
VNTAVLPKASTISAPRRWLATQTELSGCTIAIIACISDIELLRGSSWARLIRHEHHIFAH